MKLEGGGEGRRVNGMRVFLCPLLALMRLDLGMDEMGYDCNTKNMDA